MMDIKRTYIAAAIVALLWHPLSAQTETLPPLKDGQSPQTVAEAWAGVDPQVEPLDTEIHKEWEEEGVVLRAVRYRIGVFKGEKAWMGALYGFPTGGTDLPAIVQVHGGGGMASKQMCIDNAKRGYATISLSWRGDPRYLESYELPDAAQTDWGAVEGRQVNGTRDVKSESEKHYDPVSSARNNGYFLRALAARRALTFLERQPEVDGNRMGVDGFSMGGVITFLTAATDRRVKAASPWWAPPLLLDGSLKGRTAVTNAYAEHIKCPLMIMAPSNDFHGKVEDVAWMVDHIPSKDVHIARAVHYNHKNDASSMAARELWFDSHLKDGYAFPKQPEFAVKLDPREGRLKAYIRPDESMPIAHVDVFHTRDGLVSKYPDLRTRYWQYSKSQKEGDFYRATLELFDSDKPVWVFANVYYQLNPAKVDAPVTDPSDTFTVTTRLKMLSQEDLAAMRLQKDDATTRVIEDFEADWVKEWIVKDRQYQSWKLNDDRLSMPEYAKLVLDLQSDEANHISIEYGSYRGTFSIKGGGTPQQIEVYPFDLKEKKSKANLLNWSDVSRPNLVVSSSRTKAVPDYQRLRWEPITKDEYLEKRPFQLGDAPRSNSKVALTFALADHVDGRSDAEGNSVKLDESLTGVDVKDGLQVHSQDVSEVTYYTKGEFSIFSATLIPCYQASAAFEVHADGKKLFESEMFRGKTAPKDISVDIRGVQELKLVVSEGGNGWGGDWVMWGRAAVE